jgi:hypothetical protein
MYVRCVRCVVFVSWHLRYFILGSGVFPAIPGVKGACRTLRRETGKSPAEKGARREMSG